MVESLFYHCLTLQLYMKANLLTAIALLCCHWAYGCLWDYDTIEMERRQFPNTLELITGKFLRHTPEFYYWRVRDRADKLKKSPDRANLYDDLAVAYSKLGDNTKAIALMAEKEAIAPNKYKTYANLGTFYIHDGQYEKGIQQINKALTINPDAHFGREIYQKLLVEYLLTKMQGGPLKLPLNNKLPPRPYSRMEEGGENFYLFLMRKGVIKENRVFNHKAPIAEDLKKAIKGIEGMMRFGNFQSPVLLEALGDLLMQDGDYQAGRQLAARAYLKASYQVKNANGKEAYRKKATFALALQYTQRGGTGFSLEDLESLFQEELKEGEQHYQKIRANEHDWILDAKDLDKEFSEKYFKAPSHGLRVQKSSGKTADQEYRSQKPELDKVFVFNTKGHPVYVDSVVKAIIDKQFGTAAGDPSKEQETVAEEGKEEEGSNLTFLLYLGSGIALIVLLILRIRFRSLSKEGRFF